ncbi:MAG TPA: hypothetical protein VGS80_05805 [Ktedonobacterales bacterium]|nr:hypothetical protein [Ktedonobacterales bacterium]
MSTPTGPFDYRHLRALLAHQQVTHKRFAAVCGLNYCFLNRILCGRRPGELARTKIERGLRSLGMPEAVAAVGVPFPEEEARNAAAS